MSRPSARANILILLVLLLASAFLVGLQCSSSESVFHAAHVGDFEIQYWKTAERRIDRTHFEYSYSASLHNAGPDIIGATARVQSSSASTLVADESLAFPSTTSGTTSTSIDTFSIIQDRAASFDPNALVWQVNPWVPVADPITGATLPASEPTKVAPLPTEASIETVRISESEDLGTIQVARFPNPGALPLVNFIPTVWIVSDDALSATTTVAGLPATRFESDRRRSVLTFIDTGADVVLVHSGNFRGPGHPGTAYYDSFLESFVP